jgi:hypothetical protein
MIEKIRDEISNAIEPIIEKHNVQAYIILQIDHDNKKEQSRSAYNIAAFELLGILEYTKIEILKQIKGLHSPDKVVQKALLDIEVEK